MKSKRIETLSIMPMYICDGKRKCSGSLACHNHPLGLCNLTSFSEHALHQDKIKIYENFINNFDFDIEYDGSILRVRCVEKGENMV